MEPRYTTIRPTGLLLLIPSLGTSAYAQPQNALDFDGLDDQVIVGSASSTIAGSAALSLTCWVYPRNTVTVFPDLDGYAGFRNELDADFYLVQIYDNVLEGRLRNSSGTAFTVTTTSAIALNTWHHVGLIYDGTTLAIWIDGNLVVSGPASGTISNTVEPFLIGNVDYNGQPFHLDGKLDEIALWRRALTAEEMDCLSALPPSMGHPDLAFYYGCDQGTPGGNNTTLLTLTDATGNIDGDLVNFALMGATSNFVQGTVFGTEVSDTFCPGGSYNFNGQVLTAPGVYTASIPTGGLCDSTVVLTLTEATVNTSVVQNANTLIATATGTYQWIDCDNNNTPISGATGQYYLATANGDYAVIVTQGGCADTSLCYNITGIGMADIAGASLRVQGDVVHDGLWIEVGGAAAHLNAEVIDPTGRVVMQRTLTNAGRQTLDVTGLTSGVHFLRISSAGQQRVFRFVKE